MKILLGIIIILWIAWFNLEFFTDNSELRRNELRQDLNAMSKRIKLSDHGVEYFYVNYDFPHYVGLIFDDKTLYDSLYRYTGNVDSPDIGLSLKWTVYQRDSKVNSRIFNKPTGRNGVNFVFGEFDAYTGKKYKLELNVLKFPSFLKNDSALLEIGVNRAVVSVGNEFAFEFSQMISNTLSRPLLWTSIVMTLLYLIIWVRIISLK
jgi:hypothetical protein